MAIFGSGTITNLLIIAFSTFVVVTAIYFKWAFNYWKRRGVQSPPASVPFGNMTKPTLQKVSPGEEIKNIYEEYRSKGLRYAGMYIFAKPIFLVFDPELIKNILIKDFQYFTDHGSYINEERDTLSGHLFNLKGLKWKNVRAKLTPTFTSGKMKMMFHTLMDCSDELINLMNDMSEKHEAFDVKDIIGRLTTDIISSCAFGIECNSLKNPKAEFREYGKRVFETGGLQGLKTTLAFCFPQVLEFFNVAVNRDDVTRFIMNIVSETISYRESNNIARKDFMHLLIQLKNNVNIQEEGDDNLKQSNDGSEVGRNLTMSELTAQAYVFFIAGFETTSTTLTFCFYELVTNLDVQEKLRQEIKGVLEKHNQKLSYEAIMEMTYLDKCINETLRKYPPIPFLNRECNRTYKVPESDVTIENGTMVFIPILGIQRDPEYYPNPEKFDPERFSPESKAERHAFTWLPFGEGPRACIALRFGLLQTKVALAVLINNYRFTLNSRTRSPLFLDPKAFVMTAKGSVWLNVEKLTS